MKYILSFIAILVAFYFCIMLFNEFNPWVGWGLFIAIVLVVGNYVIKKIKKYL